MQTDCNQYFIESYRCNNEWHMLEDPEHPGCPYATPMYDTLDLAKAKVFRIIKIRKRDRDRDPVMVWSADDQE